MAGGKESPLPKACIFCHSGRERDSVRKFCLYVTQWRCAAQDSPEVSILRRCVSIIRVIEREKRFQRKLFENSERDEIANETESMEKKEGEREKEKKTKEESER